MHPTHAKKPASVLIGLLLALALPASAFATTTSGAVSETLTVASSVTVQNVPSTGTFVSPPACFPSVSGCLSSDYSYSFTSTFGTNNASGLSVAAEATTLVNGASTVPLSARGIVWGSAAGFTRGPSSGVNLGALSPSTPFLLGSTSAVGSVAVGVEPLLRIDPSTLAAGNFTGTLTIVVSTNP